MKILVNYSGAMTGMIYYRQVIPFKNLLKETNWQIHSSTDILNVSQEEFSTYDYVFIQRGIGDITPIAAMREQDYEEWILTRRGMIQSLVQKIKDSGAKLIFDVDDYWKVGTGHAMYRQSVYMDEEWSTQLYLMNADVVWVTTDVLKSKALKFNTNVHVIPNAIDETEKQFEIKPTTNNRVRFGWFGGVFHEEDVALMQDSFAKVYTDKELRDKVQLCLAGFNPHYDKLEMIFTDKYRHLSTTYLKYLQQVTPNGNHLCNGEVYKRIWARQVTEYVEGYNEVDVCLAPLRDNTFNNCKSQLKIIEAGYMGKALIASKCLPYTIDLKHNHNAFLVDEKRGHKDWYKAIKMLTNSPELRNKLALNLQAMVKDKFNIQSANEKRITSLCKSE